MKYLQSLCSRDLYHTNCGGIIGLDCAQYTDYSRHIHTKLLKIFRHFNLDYRLFAGALIGYIRNKEIPIWNDDLDAMIFQDEIEKFESIVKPNLINCGFQVYPPGDFLGGGSQIFSLMSELPHEEPIRLTNSIDFIVPHPQLDVFYSCVDENGIIRNLAGCGLYHRSNVPYSLGENTKEIELLSQKVRVFEKFQEATFLEYGDVLNNIVIANHFKTILEIKNVSWQEMEIDIEKLQAIIQPYPVSISEHMIRYNPTDRIYETVENESLESILINIINTNSNTVHLIDPAHLFFAADLKRIIPEIKVVGHIYNQKYDTRISHFIEFFDCIEAEDWLKEKIYRQIHFMNSFITASRSDPITST